MAEYMDYFNREIMGIVQMLTGWYFFGRLMQKKGKLSFYIIGNFDKHGRTEGSSQDNLRSRFSCVTAVFVWFVLMKMLPSGRIMELTVFALLLAAGGIVVYRADVKSAAFYAALTVEVMQLSYGIVNNLLGILYPHVYTAAPDMIGMAFSVLGNLALVLAALCYRTICRYFLYYEMIEKRYVLTVMIPILMIFLMGEYMNYVMMHDMDFAVGSGSLDYRIHCLMLVIQLFAMASLFCILYAYKRLLQNFRLCTELSLLEQEEHSLNRYVEEAKANYEKTKSFRHDVKNHMTVLKELLLNGQTEEAVRYLADMEDLAETMSFPCSTNNPVVDVVIGSKLGLAKSMGIDVSCPLVLPAPCPVREIDLCMILANALDNAIHACKSMEDNGEKYICVMGRMQGDFMLLEVENSYDGSGSIRQGTGLSNIGAVAEKYHGTMNIKTQGTVFTISVLLIAKGDSQSEGTFVV